MIEPSLFNIPQVSLLFFGLSQEALNQLFSYYTLITFKILSLDQTSLISNKPMYPMLMWYLHLNITKAPPAQCVPNNLWPPLHLPYLDLFPVFSISVCDIITDSVTQPINIESSLTLLLPYTEIVINLSHTTTVFLLKKNMAHRSTPHHLTWFSLLVTFAPPTATLFCNFRYLFIYSY